MRGFGEFGYFVTFKLSSFEFLFFAYFLCDSYLRDYLPHFAWYVFFLDIPYIYAKYSSF